MQIEKNIGESNFDYHKRLVYGKLVDKTFADIDYSELSEPLYDQQYSSDHTRKMMHGSLKTLELLEKEGIESITDEDVISDMDAKMVELKKERQKFFDQRAALNKVIREQSRREELNEILVAAVRDGNLPSLDYKPNNIEATGTTLLVGLNDMHYGASVNNRWNVYNPDICRDMLCEYIDNIIKIGETHNASECIVFCNGDMISGNIHHTIQIANKENVINQVKGVSELVAEFLAELSSHFATVKFISIAGNHSRIDTKDRAPIDERLDDLVEWYLEARLQNFDNIIIGCQEKIDSTMYLIDINGKTYCGVHGDMGNGKADISAVRAMAQRDVYAILCGHKHHNMIDEVQGVKIIMSGSFLGMDDFCIKKRVFGRPEQLVCVCDDTGIVCHYDINF